MIGPIMKATQAMHKMISRKSVADAYGGNIRLDVVAKRIEHIVEGEHVQ